MRFFTKHRFSLFDLAVFITAISMPKWWIAMIVVVAGAVISVILENIYGTR